MKTSTILVVVGLVLLLVLGSMWWMAKRGANATTESPTGTSTSPLIDNTTSTGTNLPDTGVQIPEGLDKA